jgi:DNA-binding NarL/FixJ family response regulator
MNPPQSKRNLESDKSTIRIVIADSHAVLAEGLSALLEAQRDMKVVGTATDAADAAHLGSRLRPDVAIVAINSPGMNGIEITRQIRKLSAATRILILSSHSGAEYVYEAFRAGAEGYVVKEARAAEVIDAVRRVSKGKRYMSEAISNLLIGDIAGERRAGDPVGGLTGREREVLRLTVQGKSSAQSAKALGLSPKTIESYRSRIMRKLEIHDVPGLVKFAIRHGLASLD